MSESESESESKSESESESETTSQEPTHETELYQRSGICPKSGLIRQNTTTTYSALYPCIEHNIMHSIRGFTYFGVFRA